jgi:hypothetical protein
MAAVVVDGKALAPHPDVSWRDIAGEVVAVNVRTGDYFAFNEVGRRVWLGLADGVSLAETAARIAGEYDVTEAQAFADARRFVEALSEKALIAEN